MNRHFSCIIAAATAAMMTASAKAENSITITNLWTTSGNQAVLEITMNNDDPVCAVAFNLHLPDGVTAASNGTGLQMEWPRRTDHISSGNLYDGAYSMAAMSFTNSPFAGNDGVVCRLVLEIPENIICSNYTVMLSDIEMTNPNNTIYRMPDVQGMLKVAQLPGDADNDGNVDKDDVTAISEYILGSKTPASWNAANADANWQEGIDVSDIIKILQLMK